MSELQQLRDRVAELERAFGLDAELPLRELLQPKSSLWTNKCEPLAKMLLAREFVGRETAFVALYGDRNECDQPDIKIINVLIVHLRAALRPYQVTITTSWGRGYYMTAAQKEAFRGLIERRRRELLG